MEGIDSHLGKRLRRRRRLLGLTQQNLGEAVGVRFQQIQKYECAQNRISAAMLWQLCCALEVSSGYFFEGLNEGQVPNEELEAVMTCVETKELIRAYYLLGELQRHKFLELVKTQVITASSSSLGT